MALYERPTDMRAGGVRRTALIAGLAAVALIASGCGTSEPSPTPPSTEGPATGLIPQPDVGDLPVAPENDRVDLAMPIFSNPTSVTNPLFPVSEQHSVLQLGNVDGEPFRAEVTLLPETRIVDWDGQLVEVLVSQYVAYVGGRIEEVAYDLYAQDDAGAVWYFGEDVFNFADGAIVDTHGTWLAGRDGPAAMIMPADPQVGDVYRPENIPGLVFEEVVVKAVDQQAGGPLGPVDGLLLIEEHHMDGVIEDKTFAPGYGEFFTGAGGDVEALAVAVPTDALSEPVPDELATLHDRALDACDAAADGDWEAAAQARDDLVEAWDAYSAGDLPAPIEPIMADALAALADAVDGEDADAARAAAIDVAGSALDLHLRHRPPVEVDLARMALWSARMTADADADDFAAVNGDYFVIDYIRDRIFASLAVEASTDLNLQLEELLSAIGDEDAEAVVDGAQLLRETLAAVT